MALSHRKKGLAGLQVATGAVGGKQPAINERLSLPHERDESSNAAAAEPDPLMAQARRDIDAGLVDTDMRAAPGLDAHLRGRLVPGPGGKAQRKGG